MTAARYVVCRLRGWLGCCVPTVPFILEDRAYDDVTVTRITITVRVKKTFGMVLVLGGSTSTFIKIIFLVFIDDSSSIHVVLSRWLP